MPSPVLLPIDFVLARHNISWRELLVGLDRGWVQPRDALTLAHRRRAIGDDSPELDALLELGPSDRVMPHVMALAALEPEQDPREMIARWGELALAWTWHYREALGDPLATVADLWSDFDFPPSWEPFIHYLAAADDDADAAATRARALDRWERFVASHVPPTT
ncbi:MAG: DUF2247 family protein [Gemmatimonadaceae bacterium]|jgi:hypothetical protein|nr:DUF2247 family protein [Gemmatimonadaceae bacterium]